MSIHYELEKFNLFAEIQKLLLLALAACRGIFDRPSEKN